MNLEVEKYEGELRHLRERVKELEIDISYLKREKSELGILTYDELTVQQDKLW